MKITNKLPQFINKKTLIIVSGTERAVFYKAYYGEIKSIGKVEELPRHYSDKEGFFERRGFGKYFGSGSVYESNKNEREKKFIIKINKKVTDLKRVHNFNQVYIFAPMQIGKRIGGAIDLSFPDKEVHLLKHNYIKMHPFIILEKIKEERFGFVGKKLPLSKEARKILKRYNNIHRQ